MIRTAVAALMFLASTAAAGNDPLPFRVGGSFTLVDQYGQTRTEADPDGHAQLLFFGYANCPGICTAALPMIAEVTDMLTARGLKVRPVMITVDPDRDRVGTMTAPLAEYHADLLGLTGDQAALDAAYAAFSVQRELAFVDPVDGPVYVHGGFVYLLDAGGQVLTLFPPVQGPEHVAEVAAGYLNGN